MFSVLSPSFQSFQTYILLHSDVESDPCSFEDIMDYFNLYCGYFLLKPFSHNDFFSILFDSQRKQFYI